MSKYDQIKQRVYQCNLDLPKYGVVIFSFGNVSAIDRKEGVVAIKPSGIAYDTLRPDDIVVLDLDGKVIEGTLRSSSDTNTHLVLYRYFDSIGGVAHTHSTYAVSWAQAARPIPILGTTHADHLHTDIPCTDFMDDSVIENNYELETGHQILTAMEKMSPEQVEMILVAGHGPFTWGKSPEQAVYNSVILEKLAEMALLTRTINPGVPRLKETLIQKHYQRKHGPNAYYGQK